MYPRGDTNTVESLSPPPVLSAPSDLAPEAKILELKLFLFFALEFVSSLASVCLAQRQRIFKVWRNCTCPDALEQRKHNVPVTFGVDILGTLEKERERN